ncbi:MAG: glycosyltransferase family 4 protein, partial [Ktedonobacteraceae bacterium]
MRICYVAFQFWPSVGGSQAQAEKQARYLRQLGQDVIVVTLRHQKVWPARDACSTFPVIRVGGWYRRDGTLRVGRLGHIFANVQLFLTLWRLRRNYDLIHTLQLSPLAVVATMIGRLTRKPVIVGVQSTGPCKQRGSYTLGEQPVQTDCGQEEGYPCREVPYEQKESGGDIAALQERAWGGRWMLKYLRKSEAYYQILSSRSYIYMLQHGFRPERLVYIPNGVDTQQFYPTEQVGRPDLSERVVLCVARLEYAKGIDVLLHAWAYMLKLPADWRAGLHLRLYLVGSGSRRTELECLAATLEIQSSVEFLGTRRDILHLLQCAWGFVLPSRWEGMPNALLEAMACGLPCIASRVSGSEDIIEQGSNGLLVESERPEQLAHALRLLVEDANLARQLGWGGYKTVLCDYQLSSTVQR